MAHFYRDALVAASVLVAPGWGAGRAIETVREAHKGAVETPTR